MNALLRGMCLHDHGGLLYNTMSRPQFTTTSFIKRLYHYVILQNLISYSFIYSYLKY